MCEIIMLISGIITLIRGKFLLTRAKEVRGAPARIIGLVLVLPFPLSFVLVVLASVVLAVWREPVNEANLKTMAMVIEAAMVGICFISAIAIAMATAQPVRKTRPGEGQDDVNVPDHYRDRFESRMRDGSDSQDITERPSRSSDLPDDRIRR